MSISWVINAALTILIMVAGFHFANRIVKNAQQREQSILEQGDDVYVTILSMKQSGVFINNNPVVTMALRVANVADNKTWLLEKHNETIQLITLDAYQVGAVYRAKLDSKTKSIVFVTAPSNGKPLAISNVLR